MQREIKFRAWDKRREVMLYKNFWDRNWYFTPKNDENGCHTDDILSCDQKHWYEVMQYTGLKDKNGVEIYEGDLVILANGETNAFYDFSKPFIVTRKGANLYFIPGHTNNPTAWLAGTITCLVVGNIYEHPHLLEGK